MLEVRQVLQWCPSAHDVVTLTVEGTVLGRMIQGKVKTCYTCNPKKCEKTEFCWVNREILTVLDSG